MSWATRRRLKSHDRHTWTFLDLTPLDRQEEWEDSPHGWPQAPPYEWWRLHDGYAYAAALTA